MLSKCFIWFNNLDKTITRRLHEAQIITRPVKSNGLWCCVLLPTILTMYCLFYEVSDLYKIVAFVSLGLLIYSILFINFLYISCLVVKKPIYGGCITCGLVSSLFICVFMSQGIILSLVYSTPFIWAYNILLRHMLKVMPRAFTVGEAMVVAQAAVLSSLTVMIDLFQMRSKNPVDVVIYSVLSTVGLIVTALYYLKCEYRTWRIFTILIGVGATYAILLLYYVLRDDIFILILSLFTDSLRRRLLVAWAVLTLCAVVLVCLRTRAAVKADTATRKTFHILATLVFLSGIILDSELIWLAAGAAFGLLILVEALRKFDVEPFSTFLEPAFNAYCDEKEIGGWALTPLYLVAGLAGPLALVPRPASTLERLAGVLTVGVGDSAASFIGSRYGRSSWRGSSKTVGGMLANLSSQMLVISVLYMYGVCGRGAAARGAAAAAAAALLEASTDQVDNLILPLVAIVAFQLTDIVNILI